MIMYLEIVNKRLFVYLVTNSLICLSSSYYLVILNQSTSIHPRLVLPSGS